MAKSSAAHDWLAAQPNRPHISLDPLLGEQIPVSKLKFKILSDELVTLNDEKAASYIELPVFKGERDVKETHVQKLYDEMVRGLFNPLLVILAKAEFQGIVYKINGQHTCWAKFDYPGYAPKVREIFFKVESIEDLRQLYSTSDRNLVRDDKHITLVELSNNVHLKDFNNTLLKFMVTAFKFWMFETSAERKRCSPQDLALLIDSKHMTVFRAVTDFVYHFIDGKKEAQFLRRSPVVAAMLETFSKVPTIAPQFWQPICDSIGLESKTDARWALRTFLSTVRLGASKLRTLSEEDMYRHCIPAFNKWRKGEAVQQLRPAKERIRAI